MITMKLPPTLLATRAITVELMWREYIKALGIVAIIIVVSYILSIWFLSANWWFLSLVGAFLLLGTVVLTITVVVLVVAIGFLRPSQTSEQAMAVRSFVDTLQDISGSVQTSKFIMLFRLLKDMVVPGSITLVERFALQTGTLRAKFDAIVVLFDVQD